MNSQKKAWAWIPPLYFIEGLPNAIIMGLAVFFYSELGMSDGHTLAITGALYLPWVIKPIWSPLVDSVSSKRRWILGTLACFVLCFAVLAMSPFFSAWVMLSIVAFWLLGFASATYDIAADGFYMIALREESQAYFVGIRNTFYRLAMIFAKGALLVLAGELAVRTTPQTGWAGVFAICAALCLLSLFLFKFILPMPAADNLREPKSPALFMREFAGCFIGFFRRKGIFSIFLYIVFYRFAEAMLVGNIPLFLKTAVGDGGLGLTLSQAGIINGTVGVGALLAGGIAGGVLISKYGLKKCIVPMAFAINVPNILYVFLACALPSSLFLIGSCVAVEHFGYGVGFASYMMFLIHTSKGEHKTSHYAIATGFMALGLMLPSAASGYLRVSVGFVNFFWFVCALTLVSFSVTFVAQRYLKNETVK